MSDEHYHRDAWAPLKRYTDARIAMGRAGGSLPTHEWLDFKLAHAMARDAVHQPFDHTQLGCEIEALGVSVLQVASAARDRAQYLQRPDLGRCLGDQSVAMLDAADHGDPELCIICSDGLSARAAHEQTVPLLTALLPKLQATQWQLAPIVVARFGRVALQDAIGERMNAKMALILLGERPGLGAPDSLGAYLVYKPKVGKSDAERNCVSNIRSAGLPAEAAAETIAFLLNEGRRLALTGVGLKDTRPVASVLGDSSRELGTEQDKDPCR